MGGAANAPLIGNGGEAIGRVMIMAGYGQCVDMSDDAGKGREEGVNILVVRKFDLFTMILFLVRVI